MENKWKKKKSLYDISFYGFALLNRESISIWSSIIVSCITFSLCAPCGALDWSNNLQLIYSHRCHPMTMFSSTQRRCSSVNNLPSAHSCLGLFGSGTLRDEINSELNNHWCFSDNLIHCLISWALQSGIWDKTFRKMSTAFMMLVHQSKALKPMLSHGCCTLETCSVTSLYFCLRGICINCLHISSDLVLPTASLH